MSFPEEPSVAPSKASLATHTPNLSSPAVFARDTSEFDRALNFIDAIFGFSITLLVTNLDIPSGQAWQSVSALLGGAVGDQLQGFAISFVVIAGFWRLNHRVISGFGALDSATILLCIFLVGFVIFIPFTTQGISDSRSSNLPLPTALYAVNVAVVVLATVLLVVLGRTRHLAEEEPAPVILQVAHQLAVAAVFLLSIPIAYLVSADVAKLSWLSLVVIGPVIDRLCRRRCNLGR